MNGNTINTVSLEGSSYRELRTNDRKEGQKPSVFTVFLFIQCTF